MSVMIKTVKWFVIVVLIITMLLGVLLATPLGLRTMASLVNHASNGSVVIDEIDGTLLTELSANNITIIDNKNQQTIGLHGLNIHPNIQSLFKKRLHISNIHLDEMNIQSKKENTPAKKLAITLPEKIHLPLSLNAIHVDNIKIDNFTIGNGKSVNVFNNIDVSANFHSDKVNIRVNNIGHSLGDIHGELTSAMKLPYSLTGNIQARVQSKKDGCNRRVKIQSCEQHVSLILSGAVAEKLQANMSIANYPLSNASLITPWLMVNNVISLEDNNQHIQVDSSIVNVDTTKIHKSVYSGPNAIINGDVRSVFNGISLNSHINVNNQWAGFIDKGAIPVSSLSTSVKLFHNELYLNDVVANLLGKGEIHAKTISLKKGAALGRLDIIDVDPHSLVSTANSLPLNGTVDIEGDTQQQKLSANVFSDNVKLIANALHKNNYIAINSLSLLAGDASVNANGNYDIHSKKLMINGESIQFDPSYFGDYPQAKINTKFDAVIKAAPSLVIDADIAINQSKYKNQLIKGEADIHWEDNQLSDSTINLIAGNNTINAKGSFGKLSSQALLSFTINDPSLLYSKIKGNIKGSATISGGVDDYSVSYTLSGKKLKYIDEQTKISAAKINSQGRISHAFNQLSNIELKAENIIVNNEMIKTLNINIVGTKAQHALKATAKSEVFNQSHNITLHADGGLDASNTWQGHITKLNDIGALDLRLASPFSIDVSQTAINFGLASFNIEKHGKIELVKTSYNKNAGLKIQGQLSNFNTSLFNGWLASKQLQIESHLILNGDWLFDSNQLSALDVNINKMSGDIYYQGQPLQIDTVTLSMQASDQTLESDIQLISQQLGNIKITNQADFSKPLSSYKTLSDMPLNGKAEINLPALQKISDIFSPQVSLLGSIQLSADLKGSIKKPLLHGSLRGDGLSLLSPSQGVEYHDGVLQADLLGKKVKVNKLFLQSGDGDVTLTGVLGGANTQANVVFNRFALFQRPDRNITVSGSGKAQWLNRKLNVNADIKADSGMIEYAEENKPTLSNDVYIVDNQIEQKNDDNNSDNEDSQWLDTMQLNASVDLGDDFYLNASGLDTRLSGAIQIQRDANSEFMATGSIQTDKGRFVAYGQKLDIEKGKLYFSGPVNNPGLDVLAYRSNIPIQAGVSVSGTVLSPKVTLVSTPSDLTDAEKLSWIVLGHDLSTGRSGEINMIQTAASYLLGKGASATLQNKLAKALDVDSVSLKGSNYDDASVIVGKQLKDDIYISYEQALNGASNIFKVNYDINKYWSLITQTGSDNAADIMYQILFD